MSAICGFISLDESIDCIEYGRAMMDSIKKIPSAYTKQFTKDSLFLGCSMGVITPESEKEELPFYDTKAGLSITADAIIDNRVELFRILGISMSNWNEITDSQLIILAYKKWGNDCPIHLIGDYAFAIYDENEKELFCARDSSGTRTLYYYHDANTFAFGTRIESLFCIPQVKKDLNEEWIAYFLSIPSPLHEVDSEMTVFKGIKQLPPAYSIKVSNGIISKNKYWSPLDNKELKFKNDYEYEEAFRDVFFEAVNDRLRSKGSVGIMLSGGLDSGSVACVAARQLMEHGKTLKAYCSVPFSEYVNYLPYYNIANESRFIQSICDQEKNIDVTYLQCNDKNSVTDIDFFVNLLEQPHKIIENLFWINEITSSASRDGCSVMLTGQYGNSSISFGNVSTHLVTLLKKHRYFSIIKEIRGYSRLYNLSFSKCTKGFVKNVLPDNVLDGYRKIKGHQRIDRVHLPVSSHLEEKYNTYDNLKKRYLVGHKLNHDINESRRHLSDPCVFSQIGMVNTKMSLAYGIQTRDPSADRRVIDFCFSVPGEQYVRNGHDRDLLRRSMKDILPDKIRLNYTYRGYQSADWFQRLKPVWNNIKNELSECLSSDSFRYFIDETEIRRALNEVADNPCSKNSSDVRLLVVSLIFGHFLDSLKSKSSLLQ